MFFALIQVLFGRQGHLKNNLTDKVTLVTQSRVRLVSYLFYPQILNASFFINS